MRNAAPGHTRMFGFTLLELLIVLAVLAVLAAIAIPSYRDFVLRSGRTEAQVALERLANLQEEFFSNQEAYTGSLAVLNHPATTATGLYQLTIATDANNRYVLTATAINEQREDETCRQFQLNGLGVKSAKNADNTNDTTAECWDR